MAGGGGDIGQMVARESCEGKGARGKEIWEGDRGRELGGETSEGEMDCVSYLFQRLVAYK